MGICLTPRGASTSTHNDMGLFTHFGQALVGEQEDLLLGTNVDKGT